MAARQGNSSSAVRASANKLQELGRSYGLLAINRQQRGARTAKFNKSFGTTAMQLNEVGNQMASAVDQIKYSKVGLRNRNASFDLAQMSLANKTAGATSQFGIKTESALDKFNDLTLPSFGLAQRQGSESWQLCCRTPRTLLTRLLSPTSTTSSLIRCIRLRDWSLSSMSQQSSMCRAC